ncbi:hypothetical protein [Oxynema aestuarii]|uniref:Uncharacterized protein n=1 Tax=Oxynema aestuarii AP17 TaxID=2064643 RepID=A0A6H1TUJ5_9CYAN|nr:hypothetical protein [Oxynema aestuarii]QIZ69620.1 hypothetical protein HCG48_02670 [Oxynema aestuarii AP17]
MPFCPIACGLIRSSRSHNCPEIESDRARIWGANRPDTSFFPKIIESAVISLNFSDRHFKRSPHPPDDRHARFTLGGVRPQVTKSQFTKFTHDSNEG